MELQVNPIVMPERITFNYDEIKQELLETLKSYETAVYTADQMKQAKADKANLNKLRKALNDERIKREREYMVPFNEFKAQINDLIAAIDKPVALIDKQVKAYEEQKKLEKRKQIEEFFEQQCDFPEWLKLDKIFVNSWLNASCSMKSVEDDLKAMQNTMCNELETLQSLPEFGFEATEVYKQTLNLSAAINEGKRLADIQRRKEEAERLRAEAAAKCEAARIAAENERRIAAEVAESQEAAAPAEVVAEAPISQWIAFKALLTIEQAKELRKFFDDRSIEFKAI